MPALESRVVPQGEAFQANSAALQVQLARLRELEARTRNKSAASAPLCQARPVAAARTPGRPARCRSPIP